VDINFAVMIDKYKNCMVWMCSECNTNKQLFVSTCKKIDELLYKNIKIEKNIEALHQQVKKISECNKKNIGDNKKESYADKVKNYKPVVVIEHMKDNVDGNKLEKIIKDKIDPKSIIVNKFNTTAKKLIIKSDGAIHAETCKKVIEKKLGKEVKVTIPMFERPLIRISGLTNPVTEEELNQCLNEQNDDIFEQECKFVLVYTKKTKKGDYFVIVDPGRKTFNLMVNKRLRINWDICYAAEHFYVPQCFKCQGFHHVSAHCKSEEKCGKCAKNHQTKDCKSTDEYECINCIKASCKYKKQLDCHHLASSYDCPVYKRQIEIYKKRIMYFEFK